MIYELLYTSTASQPMDEHALLDLLIESRDKNKRLSITGLLIYRQLSFMQLLEGDKHDVLDVYQSICADSRHKNVKTVFEGEVKNRGFTDWSMAYLYRPDDPFEIMLTLADENALSEGFVSEIIASNPSTARTLLMSYQANM